MIVQLLAHPREIRNNNAYNKYQSKEKRSNNKEEILILEHNSYQLRFVKLFK